MTTHKTRGTHPLLLLFSWALLLLLGACRAQDKDTDELQRLGQQRRIAWKSSLDSVFALGGTLPQVGLRELVPQEEITDVLEHGQKIIEHKPRGSKDVITPGYYRKVTRTVTLQGQEALGEYTTELNPAVVWPGNLVYAKTLSTPVLRDLSALNAYRTAGRVTMAVLNGSTNLSQTITDYRFSEVNKHLNELVAASRDRLPAHLSYSIYAVRTLGEVAYHLRIPEQELRQNKRYQVFRDIKWENNMFKGLIVFSQDFFTLVYDDPEGGASSLFTDRLTASELAKHTGKGNPLAYISSVTYGRRFVAILEETHRTYHERSEMSNSIRKSLPNNDQIKEKEQKDSHTPPSQGDTQRDLSRLKDLSHLKIHLYLAGGKSVFSSTVSTIPTMQELEKFLVATANESNTKGYGIPVSCTIKYLDGLKPVLIPHRIDRTYSFLDYEPEQDDNKITISDLRLEGKGLADRPTAGNYSTIMWSTLYMMYIEIGYSVDGVHEQVITLAREVNGDFKRGFDYHYPNQELPVFGVSPRGYIRFSFQGVHSIRRENPGWFGGSSDNSNISFYRNVYFRFNPATHEWYMDSDNRSDRDVPFRSFGFFSDEQYCPVEFNLHYRISTKLQGVLPHTKP